MQKSNLFALSLVCGCLMFFSCQPQAGNTNMVNSNTNVSNSFANSSNFNTSNTNASGSSVVEATEPNQYQATVTLTFEALGEQQKAALPPIIANVARNNEDRRMEFALPNGEKVVYVDTAGSKYIILPNRRQYAELNKDSVGFEIRQMLMPAQIVNQVKNLQGIQRVGEETINGRQVVKYSYAATANTQTQAGQVNTESFLLVDKETGLPLRSETVSQAQAGANVQGYKGARLVTEMSNIQPNVDPSLFTVPTDYAKIDAEQVRAQVSLLFNAAAAIVGQAMQQAQPAPNANMAPAR